MTVDLDKNEAQHGLTPEELWSIQEELDVEIDIPIRDNDSNNEQFSIWVAAPYNKYVGDICAESRYFTQEELKTAIRKLIERKQRDGKRSS